METAAPDWLDRDVIACLEEKCGTLVDAVLIAYASGSVGDELDSLGVRDMSTFGGADVYVPEGRERVVWARVVEYHGCGAQTEAELDEREAVVGALPAVPSEAAAYTHGTLQKAVRAFDDDQTPGDVARGAKLPLPDARRVRLLREHRLFRLNDVGKLVASPRIARKGKKYVLRYLSDDGSRWLDPLRELRG